MPASWPERIKIELSSKYLGLKLIWAIRLFLLGKKFPSGQYQDSEWKSVVSSVMELITQTDFMQTLCEIDPEAFF